MLSVSESGGSVGSGAKNATVSGNVAAGGAAGASSLGTSRRLGAGSAAWSTDWLETVGPRPPPRRAVLGQAPRGPPSAPPAARASPGLKGERAQGDPHQAVKPHGQHDRQAEFMAQRCPSTRRSHCFTSRICADPLIRPPDTYQTGVSMRTQHSSSLCKASGRDAGVHRMSLIPRYRRAPCDVQEVLGIGWTVSGSSA